MSEPMPHAYADEVREIVERELSRFVAVLAEQLERAERDANMGRLYARHLRPLLGLALKAYRGEEDYEDGTTDDDG